MGSLVDQKISETIEILANTNSEDSEKFSMESNCKSSIKPISDRVKFFSEVQTDIQDF